jgi:hypothetical protein
MHRSACTGNAHQKALGFTVAAPRRVMRVDEVLQKKRRRKRRRRRKKDLYNYKYVAIMIMPTAQL